MRSRYHQRKRQEAALRLPNFDLTELNEGPFKQAVLSEALAL